MQTDRVRIIAGHLSGAVMLFKVTWSLPDGPCCFRSVRGDDRVRGGRRGTSWRLLSFVGARD